MMKKKTAIVLLILTMLLTGCSVNVPESEDSDKKTNEISCWYTEDTDKNWLESAAKSFEKEYGIKVNLVYYDGVSFTEDLNAACQEGKAPSVYLLGNDRLEFAVLSGMAEENKYIDESLWKDKYPKTAKDAATYGGKQYGYPVYFDTYCLVYDAKLLETAPASIDDILTFLDAYEDTGSTKAVFRWDVADPYINTMFLAGYSDLFGENGDDSKSFKINGEKSVEAMKYFQSLSEYLWMNKGNISHDIIINRIKDKTLVLGLCKSDILPVLYEMQNDNSEGNETDNSGDGNGTEETDYRISYVPALTAELNSVTLSTTCLAFVNPYGEDSDAGNKFAFYLSYEYADKQFDGNGKLPVINQSDKFDEFQKIIYAQYINSKPVPKVMELGDYLSESGITFDAIWEGKDAKEELDKLQQIMEEKIK